MTNLWCKNKLREDAVATVIHQNLFSWQELDGSSDLYRLQLVLSYLPDEAMVDRLERNRGRDRCQGTPRFPQLGDTQVPAEVPGGTR